MTAKMPSRNWSLFIRPLIFGRRPGFTLLRIVLLVTAIVLVRQFVLLPIKVMGPSMLPTYQDRGVNLVNRLAYASHEPQRGDVVAIRTSGESTMFMKRVIAFPGETIAFHEGHAVVNGTALDEPYVKFKCDWELPPQIIDPGKIFVVGDNRSMPATDHTFGQTERRRIVGKVILCKNLFAFSVLRP